MDVIILEVQIFTSLFDLLLTIHGQVSSQRPEHTFLGSDQVEIHKSWEENRDFSSFKAQGRAKGFPPGRFKAMKLDYVDNKICSKKRRLEGRGKPEMMKLTL